MQCEFRGCLGRKLRTCRIAVVDGSQRGGLSELQVGSHAVLEKSYLARWKWWPGPEVLKEHLLCEVVVRRNSNTTALGVVVDELERAIGRCCPARTPTFIHFPCNVDPCQSPTMRLLIASQVATFSDLLTSLFANLRLTTAFVQRSTKILV